MRRNDTIFQFSKAIGFRYAEDSDNIGQNEFSNILFIPHVPNNFMPLCPCSTCLFFRPMQ